MITVDLANSIFIGCLAIGGVLLLVSVLLGDILGGVMDAFHLDFDLGGVALLPVLLGFIAMFGVGGLFATEALNLGVPAASLVGALTGALGAGTVIVLFRALRGAEAPGATQTSSLVGQMGQLSVGIPVGGYGTIIVRFDGAPMERRATSNQAIPAGRRVRVIQVIGADLVVEPDDTASA